MTATRVIRFAALAAALATMPLQAYTPYTWKWATRQVPYYVNAANLDVPPSAALAAVQSAAAAWTNQSNTSFSFYYAGATSGSSAANNGRNEVFFRNASNGTAIATTYSWFSGSTTLDTDIVFWDGAYTFFTGSSGCSGGFYVEDVGTHEFGHALGLSHSAVADATMVSGQRWCTTEKRSLALDDILGVETLYPPAGTVNTAPTVTISSPAGGSSLTAGTLVTFSGSAQDIEDGTLSSRISWTSSLDGSLGTGATIQKALTAGAHTIRAAVTDGAGAGGSAQVSVSVTAVDSPPPSGVTLTAKGSKVKGVQQVDLRWSSCAWPAVDVYRNGVKVLQTANDGAHLDALKKKGGGSYTYRVCSAGTTTCSNNASVTF